MITSDDFLLSKELAIVDTWDEWWRVSPQDREKYFFMAGVSDAYILDEYRKATASICSGERTENEARRYLRDKLRAISYQAEAGKENTMEDLFSRERMCFELGLWRKLACGWSSWQYELERLSLFMYPGKELKAHQQELPQEWKEKWLRVADAIRWEGVEESGKMQIALKTSPIWAKLSVLGLPYVPFDADSHSHLYTRQVDASDCIKLGLITEKEVRAILHRPTAPA